MALACAHTVASFAQRVELRPAPPVAIPFQVDGNSPVYWKDGRLQFFTSDGNPVRAQGADQFSLSGTTKIVFDRYDHFSMWIEAIWVDADGTVYGWYHNEPGGVCSGGKLTAPRIGAVVSYDGGSSFFDLGLVLTSGDPADCNSKNGFFAGGHGDFSVIPDREQAYFYFLFTNYGGDPASQGVAVARMAFEDRKMPAGAVWKYFRGEWAEPGLDGQLTPVFPAAASWQREDTNSFWGPAIHFNTGLDTYVVLLNHACCKPGWPQEGIYISLNADLSNPAGWTEPVRLLRDIGWAPGYYPQVIGLAPGESDTLAGQSARLYIQGRSKWELIFSKGDPSISGSDSDQPLDPSAPMPGDRLDQLRTGRRPIP
jgi:hypothetical protein